MGKKASPKLPPRSTANDAAGGGRGERDQVKLPDGTNMPVGVPPGMDPAVARQVIDYLKANPQAAQQSYAQAQRFMQNPGMAQQMLEAQRLAGTTSPEHKERMLKLREDPELAAVFADIEANGPGAMEAYWNDTEVMGKIAAKMREMNISPPGKPAASAATSKPKGVIASLQGAAKAGDLEALRRFIDGGADVNARDARGITPLGVAVGFNRLPLVKELLEAGAAVDVPDSKGNTVLHYAAGYGRKEAAELLMAAGASLSAANADGQTPLDVAKTNREAHMVAYLEERLAEKEEEDGDEPGASKYL